MAQGDSTARWRTIGFVTVYGLSAVAVTAVFWQSPQPSADTATQFETTRSTLTSSSVDKVPQALTKQVTLSANTAYGIQGSVSIPNAETVVAHGFSLIGRGPKVQLELRDAAGQTVVTLKDVTKETYNAEDLVLAIPATANLEAVVSFVVSAPDYQLVLSQATW